MVTTNQKSITDTHTKDTKKSKHNTGDSYEMTKEEEINKKELQKQLTKWQ